MTSRSQIHLITKSLAIGVLVLGSIWATATESLAEPLMEEMRDVLAFLNREIDWAIIEDTTPFEPDTSIIDSNLEILNSVDPDITTAGSSLSDQAEHFYGVVIGVTAVDFNRQINQVAAELEAMKGEVQDFNDSLQNAIDRLNEKISREKYKDVADTLRESRDLLIDAQGQASEAIGVLPADLACLAEFIDAFIARIRIVTTTVNRSSAQINQARFQLEEHRTQLFVEAEGLIASKILRLKICLDELDVQRFRLNLDQLKTFNATEGKFGLFQGGQSQELYRFDDLIEKLVDTEDLLEDILLKMERLSRSLDLNPRAIQRHIRDVEEINEMLRDARVVKEEAEAIAQTVEEYYVEDEVLVAIDVEASDINELSRSIRTKRLEINDYYVLQSAGPINQTTGQPVGLVVFELRISQDRSVPSIVDEMSVFLPFVEPNHIYQVASAQSALLEDSIESVSFNQIQSDIEVGVGILDTGYNAGVSNQLDNHLWDTPNSVLYRCNTPSDADLIFVQDTLDQIQAPRDPGAESSLALLLNFLAGEISAGRTQSDPINDGTSSSAAFMGCNFTAESNSLLFNLNEGEGVDHGTAIASIAAGYNILSTIGSGSGIVDTSLKIIPIKVCENSLLCESSKIQQGIDFVLANLNSTSSETNLPIRLLNMSFHTDSGDDKQLVRELLAFSEDSQIITVAAAGNRGNESPPPRSFPASLASELKPNSFDTFSIFAAAALTSDGRRGADFSTPGPYVADGGISAIGEQITTILPNSKQYKGTSFAAPQISFLLATIVQREPSMRPCELREMLWNQTLSVPVQEESVPNQKTGFGRIDPTSTERVSDFVNVNCSRQFESEN